MRMTRRQMGALSAAFAAFGSPGRATEPAEPGMTLGPGMAFEASDVTRLAESISKLPYTAPRQVPEAWRNLKYDEYRHMWFDTRNALWRNDDVPVKVDFFPPGLYFPAPVEVYAVQDGTQAKVRFDFSVFDTTDQLPDLPIDDSLGYSGLRFLGELEKPEVFQEYAVFQGASYFRAIGRGHIYGLSARGIALNTAAPDGEEFPEFRKFWIERPRPGSEEVILHALLDGPSVAGAYRFRIIPGATTVMDVEATIFPRVELSNVGIAAETSMFFFDQTNRHRFDDFRPAVHDSDGLMIRNGAGEHIWRPLANPSALQVSSFVDESPRGFGLMQRARRFSDFADLQAKYHSRPGLWVEPGEDWGAGAVTLVEIPTDREIYDNIVAYWRPRTPLAPGQAHRFTYRLHWCTDAPVTRDRAHVLNTHMGKGFSTRRVAAIDFAPHPMTPREPGEVQTHVSTNRGKVTDGILQGNPETGGLRLDFGFEPPEARGMELRAQLVLPDGKPVSEVWLYRWTH